MTTNLLNSASSSIEITPQERAWWLLLRAKTPISHHDPGQMDKSNRSLFRRQAKYLPPPHPPSPPPTKGGAAARGGWGVGEVGQAQVDALLEASTVPRDIADLLQTATLEQFLATAIFKSFIDIYNSEMGIGLFSGMERYRFLEERFQHAAIMSLSLLEMWGRACANLQVPPVPAGEQNNLLRLLTMPAILGQMVLRTISQFPRPCLMLARAWHETGKLQSEHYAAAAKQPQADPTNVHLTYQVEALDLAGQGGVVNLPVVSANSLRHQLIREPAMWHLFARLGLAFDEPAPATTAMFYNGGDIAGGVSAPADVFWLRREIRAAFPSLALISGATDTFVLGEGSLNVYGWLVCRENNDALADVDLASQQSIFGLLDDWRLTRHAGLAEIGQMFFDFETLIEGMQIAVRLSLSPYAGELQVGALMAALETYRRLDATIGGQSARGFGLVDLNFHRGEFDQAALAAYENYLSKNKEALRQHLVEGTLGTKKVVIKS